MAKPLILTFGSESSPFDLNKVERSKLYGFVETEVFDETGKKCELATLAGDGKTLAGKGGTGLGYRSPTGEWRAKSGLTAVDLNGDPIVPVKSTFDAPVPLTTTATIDEFLAHSIHTIYLLTTEEPNVPLLESLREGTIYTFPFSFRGGLEANAGFVLLGADGNMFLLVGTPSAIEFIGLQATAAVVADEAAEAVADDDLLDFSLV